MTLHFHLIATPGPVECKYLDFAKWIFSACSYMDWKIIAIVEELNDESSYDMSEPKSAQDPTVIIYRYLQGCLFISNTSK